MFIQSTFAAIALPALSAMPHRWTTTGPRENLTRGSATALATLELCAEPADCTTDYSSSRVIVRSA